MNTNFVQYAINEIPGFETIHDDFVEKLTISDATRTKIIFQVIWLHIIVLHIFKHFGQFYSKKIKKTKLKSKK